MKSLIAAAILVWSSFALAATAVLIHQIDGGGIWICQYVLTSSGSVFHVNVPKAVGQCAQTLQVN